jgi:hypothetical protein
LQPVQVGRTTSPRTPDFLGKRTKRTTDDLALDASELLDAPTEHGGVWRADVCEPHIGLCAQTFSPDVSSQCSAERSRHEHGGHPEAE